MADIQLVHPFKDKCPDIHELLKKKDGTIVCTINVFCNNIKRLAKQYKNLIDESEFKGWALELFVEFMVKSDGSDNRIGIYDYQPVLEDDYGVDGHGIGENQRPATVQVKYRGGHYTLTANEDHLSNFGFSSVMDFGVDSSDDKNMLIIHTGKEIHYKTMESMLKGKVRELKRETLRNMYDNRPEWWTRFYEAVRDSRIQSSDKPVITLTFRQHQNEAVEAILEDHNGKGKIILPTGTGKTLIEAEIIALEISALLKNNVTALIKVNSPRILLSFQLFEEIFAHLQRNGIDAKYINFNSGKPDEEYYIAELKKTPDSIFREVISTTSPKIVQAEYQKCLKDKLPLVVVSTYHSSVKFAESGLIPDLTVNDEAHNLVSDSFCEAAVLPTRKNLFFTATPKNTDSAEERGMNNEDIFDNVIYSRTAKQMIDAGEMVPPYIHIMRANNPKNVDMEKDYTAILKSITDGFFAHERKIRECSVDPSQLGAKVLVVCKGQMELQEMFKTEYFEDFRIENPDVHVFALSSEFGIYMNGEKINSPVNHKKKLELIKRIKGLQAHEKALIFHVDMLGEGIDVPSITGVMPFRNCEMSKFAQNLGRATRLHPQDRLNFYAGKISPDDYSEYIKPYAWIVIPEYLQYSNGFSGRFQEIVHLLRTNYKFIPEETVHIDNVEGLDDEEEPDTVNDKTKNKKHNNSGVDEFWHEFEKLTAAESVVFIEEKNLIKAQLDAIVLAD